MGHWPLPESSSGVTQHGEVAEGRVRSKCFNIRMDRFEPATNVRLSLFVCQLGITVVPTS